MNKKILFFATIALSLVLTGCLKDECPGSLFCQHERFKADATPRWETGSVVEKNAESMNKFIIDTGGNKFSTTNFKTGRMTEDGSHFEIIEIIGMPVVGRIHGVTIRRPSGVSNLHRFEILKIEGDKLWMVFMETVSSEERRVVQ